MESAEKAGWKKILPRRKIFRPGLFAPTRKVCCFSKFDASRLHSVAPDADYCKFSSAAHPDHTNTACRVDRIVPNIRHQKEWTVTSSCNITIQAPAGNQHQQRCITSLFLATRSFAARHRRTIQHAQSHRTPAHKAPHLNGPAVGQNENADHQNAIHREIGAGPTKRIIARAPALRRPQRYGAAPDVHSTEASPDAAR